ncbi:unnamed protein product, partial [Prorocentrum cordatum]
MAYARRSLSARMKDFLRGWVVAGLPPNLKKRALVLAMIDDRAELNSEFSE